MPIKKPDILPTYGIKDISNMNIPGPTDKRDFEGFDTTVAGNGPHDDHSDFIPENAEGRNLWTTSFTNMELDDEKRLYYWLWWRIF